jgi:chorismate dehydratase
MRRLKISAISFLNTAPLMWDFEHPTPENQRLREDFEFTYTVPSKCAQELLDGSADIGIIPSITFATIPGLAILPDVAIASKNKVRSILLVLKKPVEQVRTVALDTSSRTSVALTKILLSKFIAAGTEKEYVAMDPNVDEMLRTCDAGLLIGDPALRVDRTKYFALDLAEEWRRLTGKPFVFAFWAVRMEALSRWPEKYDLASVFCRSRDHGLLPQNVEVLARDWAPRMNLTTDDVQRYLTENIHYYLDAENCDGLELFFRYAAELRLIPEVPHLRLLGSTAFRFYR